MLTNDGLSGAVPRHCPACGSAERILLAQLQAAQFCKVNSTYRTDFAAILGIAPDTAFPLNRCHACAFVYAGLLPPSAFLQNVYDQVIDADRGFFESTSPGWVAHQLMLGSELLDRLGRLFADDVRLKILDFGCGYGALVRALSGPRVSCLGFETSPRRLAYLESQGLPVCSRVEEATAGGPYHAIVLSDVLEHLPAPRDTLALCRRLLTPGGLLYVHVPDFRDERLSAVLAAVPSGGQTRELNLWEHLNYFSPESLRRMLTAAGFEVLDSAAVDIGLRPGLHGVRRLGNTVKSGLRLARYALGGRLDSTALLAQRARTTCGNRLLIRSVGGDEMANVWDILKLLEAISGRKAMIREEPARSGDQHYTLADTTRLRELTDWKPRTQLADGLHIQWEWQCAALMESLS